MQMKNLLRLMGSLALSAGAITSVVACGQQATVNLDTVLKETNLGNVSVVDVAKPTVDEIKNAIKAISANKEINLAGIIVKIADTNDSAVVSPDGTIYNGNDITVTFTLVAKKQDIKDVIVADLQTPVDDTKTFGDLNADPAINDAVVTAIKTATGLDVVAGTDFTLKNDKTATDKQIAGAVEFTVEAQGNKITGTFNFTDTLK